MFRLCVCISHFADEPIQRATLGTNPNPAFGYSGSSHPYPKLAYDLISRWKFSTRTPRQPMVEYVYEGRTSAMYWYCIIFDRHIKGFSSCRKIKRLNCLHGVSGSKCRYVGQLTYVAPPPHTQKSSECRVRANYVAPTTPRLDVSNINSRHTQHPFSGRKRRLPRQYQYLIADDGCGGRRPALLKASLSSRTTIAHRTPQALASVLDSSFGLP